MDFQTLGDTEVSGAERSSSSRPPGVTPLSPASMPGLPSSLILSSERLASGWGRCVKCFGTCKAVLLTVWPRGQQPGCPWEPAGNVGLRPTLWGRVSALLLVLTQAQPENPLFRASLHMSWRDLEFEERLGLSVGRRIQAGGETALWEGRPGPPAPASCPFPLLGIVSNRVAAVEAGTQPRVPCARLWAT